MAKIPTAIATPGSVGYDAPRPSLSVFPAPQDNTGEAMMGLGRAVQQAGAAGFTIAKQAETDQEKAQKEAENTAKYGLDTALVKFRSERTAEYDEAQRSVPVGEDGKPEPIAPSFIKTFDARAEEFLKTVPEKLRPQYGLKLMQLKEAYRPNAVNFDQAQADAFTVNQLSTSLDTLKKSMDVAPSQSSQYINEGVQLIRNAPGLTPAKRTELEKQFMREGRIITVQAVAQRDPGILDRTRFSGKTPDFGGGINGAIDDAANAAGVDPGMMRRFARIESSGNPNNVTGSYKGLFQLSDAEFQRYGGGNIFDPDDNARAAARKIAAESKTFEATYGRPPTAADLYMVHQQGEAGYAAHMANPNAPAWVNMASTGEGRQKGAGWAKAAIWGNIPSDRKGDFPGGVESVTSAEFVDMWRQKVDGSSAAPMTGRAEGGARSRSANIERPQGAPPKPSLEDLPEFQALPFADQQSLMSHIDAEDRRRAAAEREANNAERARMAAEQKAMKERLDLAIETGGVKTEADILDNPIIDDGDKAMLLRRFREHSKENNAAQVTFDRLQNGDTFNQFDPEDRKGIDALYKRVDKALSEKPDKEQAAREMRAFEEDMIAKTGVVPSDVTRGIRGGLASMKPEQVGAALDKASRILSIRPNPFDGQEGGETIERAALAYRKAIEFGMAPADAARQYMERQAPEFRRNEKVRREEVGKLTKELTISDVTDTFDPGLLPLGVSPLQFEPDPGAPRAADAILADYRDLFAEAYMETGDKDSAKAIAAAGIKKVYGVSNVTGRAVLMKKPPEKFFPAVEGSHDYIGTQLEADVKAAAGVDVKRDKISILPLPTRPTERPAYQVMYQDADAIWHAIPTPAGKGWRPDPAAAQAEVTSRIISEGNDTHRRMTKQAVNPPRDAATPGRAVAGPQGRGGYMTQAEADAANAAADARDQAVRAPLVDAAARRKAFINELEKRQPGNEPPPVRKGGMSRPPSPNPRTGKMPANPFDKGQF